MIYPQTEKITFTGNCPKKKFRPKSNFEWNLETFFFQIHDEKPDPITEISVDILSCSHSDKYFKIDLSNRFPTNIQYLKQKLLFFRCTQHHQTSIDH